ncbi:hypothetical protein RF11_05913 [Thelohanellus kitauei]|uniref:Uncharacterized protein n=1 Tax=Thelohanellus kitauei TaxID=669202 RepID=A0A0C2IWT6_THEKT|nr:hypothetical protein RF11_05913 [Thelohanellus kitauei]
MAEENVTEDAADGDLWICPSRRWPQCCCLQRLLITPTWNGQPLTSKVVKQVIQDMGRLAAALSNLQNTSDSQAMNNADQTSRNQIHERSTSEYYIQFIKSARHQLRGNGICEDGCKKILQYPETLFDQSADSTDSFNLNNIRNNTVPNIHFEYFNRRDTVYDDSNRRTDVLRCSMGRIYTNLNIIWNNTVADNPSPYLYQRHSVYDHSSRRTDILRSSLNEIYTNLSNIWVNTVSKNSSPYSNHNELVAADSSRTSDILRSPMPTNFTHNNDMPYISVEANSIRPNLFTNDHASTYKFDGNHSRYSANSVENNHHVYSPFNYYEHIPRIIPKYHSILHPTYIKYGPIHRMQTEDRNRHTMAEIFNAPATLSNNQNLNFHPPNTHP